MNDWLKEFLDETDRTIADPLPRTLQMLLVEDNPGDARIVEELTALLIGLNIRYKVPEGLGLRITGLPSGQ